MTSNHTHLKQNSCADFIRRGVACNVLTDGFSYTGDVARNVSTSDSPRFALLPQYTEPMEPCTYYLLKSFLSHPEAKHEIGMRKPKRYLRLILAVKAGGSPQPEVAVSIISTYY